MPGSTAPRNPTTLDPFDGKPAWACDVCRVDLDTATNDGSVYLDYAEWYAFRLAEADWKSRHTSAEGWIVADAYDLAEMPTLRWHVVHDACDGAALERADIYWIDVNRLDTWAKVAEWSAHLHGREWHAAADWSNLLYRAGVGKVSA